MTEKELVAGFFNEGYVTHNYDLVLTYLAEDYLDHSPAGARSNRDAVNILRAVEGMFQELQIELLDLFAEGEMVAVRVRYHAIHSGVCMGIEATGRRISFEALEHFRVVDGKITESWGYWPDRQIEQMLS